jgi:hypothetical protein
MSQIGFILLTGDIDAGLKFFFLVIGLLAIPIATVIHFIFRKTWVYRKNILGKSDIVNFFYYACLYLIVYLLL